MKFYIDCEEVKVAASGKTKSSVVFCTPGVIKTSPAPISIGGQSPQMIDGIIDEVAILKVALSLDEIQSIMDKGFLGELGMTPTSRLATTWGEIKK